MRCTGRSNASNSFLNVRIWVKRLGLGVLISLWFCNCYGRKVMGHFDEITIGPEYKEMESSPNRVQTKYCDGYFWNAIQVGIHGAKEDVILKALRSEMEKDPTIIAFDDVQFDHHGGCWHIAYTPERKK